MIRGEPTDIVFDHWRSYLQELRGDIYEQPPDPGHTSLTLEILDAWLPKVQLDIPKTVLDVGCGQGIARAPFMDAGYSWRGVTLGQDYAECKKLGYEVDLADFGFLPYADESFSMIYSRHSLEHAPCPLMVLMEWHRVTRPGGLMILILPTPRLKEGDPGEILGGRNHYWLMTEKQWEPVLLRAGWREIWADESNPNETRVLAEWIRQRPAGTT